jgi:hypothetical protein
MFPDFLGIGAQKAGTTWLDRNLRCHPAIWLPPIKEIHHFDIRSSHPWLLEFVTGREPAIQVLLRRWAGQARHDMLVERRNVRWFLRFFLLPRSDRWYASLFVPRAGQIAGEITPGYARLDEEQTAHVHTLMPQAKIIYLLRNPILRTWSQAAMYFGKRGHPDLNQVPDEEMQRFLNRERTYRNSDYLRTLGIWEALYPASQVFVGFFEQLEQEPDQLLRDVYGFLGVDTSERHIPASVHRKVHARQYPPIPESLARRLAQQHYESIEMLHQRFANDHTASWLAFAQTHLERETAR